MSDFGVWRSPPTKLTIKTPQLFQRVQAVCYYLGLLIEHKNLQRLASQRHLSRIFGVSSKMVASWTRKFLRAEHIGVEETETGELSASFVGKATRLFCQVFAPSHSHAKGLDEVLARWAVRKSKCHRCITDAVDREVKKLAEERERSVTARAEGPIGPPAVPGVLAAMEATGVLGDEDDD